LTGERMTITQTVETPMKNLHHLEVHVLLSYKSGDALTIERVGKELGFKSGNGNHALSWLAGKGLLPSCGARLLSFLYQAPRLFWSHCSNGSSRLVFW